MVCWFHKQSSNTANSRASRPLATLCTTKSECCLKSIEERTRRHHADSCSTTSTSVLLRHVFHAVVTAHDGQVRPQRHLNVSMTQPSTDDVQRHLPDHQPMPRSAVPQAVGTSSPLTSPWRLLIETRPLDAIPDVPQRRPHGQRHHLVPGRSVRRPVGEELHQVSRTVRALRVFDFRTSNVAGSLE